MDWFKNVFLKSLDEKFDGGKDVWLTWKQAEICERYMKKSENYSFRYIISGQWQYSMVITKKGTGHMVRELKELAFH